MDIVLEFLLQVVFEVLAEVLSGAFGSGRRSARCARVDGAPPAELDAARAPRARGFWLLQVVVAAGFGFWRGGLSGGSPRWGLWLAVLVAAAALFFATLAAPNPREPAGRLGQLLAWWPRWRLIWFGLANGVFVVAYLVAMSGADAPLR